MGMIVKRSADTAQKRVFLHKLADVPGGVSVKGSELGGDALYEGTPLGAPVAGICSVVKIAIVQTAVGAAGKAIDVPKGHHFKVGQFVMKAAGGLAYAITAIDTTNANKDVITIGTTLGVIALGDSIYEAAAESAVDTSALKVIAQSLVGTTVPVVANDNVITDAILIGVTRGNPIPSVITTLTGIINI